jgi:hypothetical protein
MRKNIEEIHIGYSPISANEYNQLLDEWASTVYSYVCQQSQIQMEAPATFNKKAQVLK